MTILAYPWVQTPSKVNMKFTILEEGFLVYIIMNSVFLIEWRRLLNIICITPSIYFGPALESRTTEDMKCRIFAEWSTFQLFFLQMCGSIFKFLINYQSWQFLPCPENSYRERVMKFIIYVPFTPKNASYQIWKDLTMQFLRII